MRVLSGFFFGIGQTSISSTVVTGQTEGLKCWLRNGWVAGCVYGWDGWFAKVDNVFLRLGGFAKVDNRFGYEIWI